MRRSPVFRPFLSNFFASFAKTGRRLVPVAMAICFLLFSASVASAQQATGDVLGTVADQSEAAIPNAKVTIRNLDTNQEKQVTTGASGDFTFTALNPGSYSVTVSAQGFKGFQLGNIHLAAGDHLRANANMVLGAVTETVTVSSTSSSLQTDSSAVNTTLTERAVQDLPLNGRNFIGLVLLTPGATEGTADGPTSGTYPADRRQTSSISVNGQSASVNYQLIDGIDNIERFNGNIGVRPSIDAISEVQVQTNTFTADVGRTGGGVINVVTKAGTNKFHGSVYEFFRNDKLDAIPFAFGSNPKKSELRQNQFGGSIGGPIKHDRLFFFADYEELRQIAVGASQSFTVPTLYENQHPGDFSDTGGPVIAAGAIDKAGLNYFSLLPAPNNGLSTYTGAGKNTYYSRTVDGRTDYQLGPKDLLFVRYTYNRVTSVQAAVFPAKNVAGVLVTPEGFGNGPALDLADNAVIGYQRIVTPNLLFDLRLGYLYVNNSSQSFNQGLSPNAAFGQNGINISPSTSGLATALVLSAGLPIGTGGVSLPLIEKDNSYQGVISVTYTHGSNSLKAGGNLIRRNVFQSGQARGEGLFQFPTFASLLQGKPTFVNRNLSLIDSSFRTYEAGGYVQDDWHVRRDLTLNLGLRYDIFTPFTENHNYLSNVDPKTGKIILANVNGVNKYGGLSVDFRDIAPRIGFAYSPHVGTSVHGGFGTVFYPGSLSSATGIQRNIPFAYFYGACNEAAGTCAAGFNQFSAGLPTPVALDPANPVGGIGLAVDTNFRNTAVAQYNLFVQQDFGGNVLSIGYVGLQGKHVVTTYQDVNVPLPNTCGSGTPCQNALRPFFGTLPGITTIGLLRSTGTQNYNSLQTSFDRRASRGLTLGGSYVWAHGLDDVNTVGSQVVGASNSATKQDGLGSVPSQMHLDYGNSNLDVRNRISTHINYVLPFGSNLHGITGVLAKGWQTNLLYVWSTGIPFSVVNSTSVSNTNTAGIDRPNQISSRLTSTNPTISAYFNTAAFQVQQVGTLGQPLGYVTSQVNPTIGPLYERRNQLYGPRFRHLDISAFKTFPLTERAKLEFRAEAFNITNTTSFAQPINILQNVAFGKITSTSLAYNPRQIQFALKLNF